MSALPKYVFALAYSCIWYAHDANVVQVAPRRSQRSCLAQVFFGQLLVAYRPWRHIVEAAEEYEADAAVPLGVLAQLICNALVILGRARERLLPHAAHCVGPLANGWWWATTSKMAPPVDDALGGAREHEGVGVNGERTHVARFTLVCSPARVRACANGASAG